MRCFRSTNRAANKIESCKDSSRLLSKRSLNLLKIWAALSVLYSSWFVVVRLYFAIKTSKWSFEELLKMATSIEYLLSMILLWYKWKKVADVLRDFVRFLEERNRLKALNAVKNRLRNMLLLSLLIGGLGSVFWIIAVSTVSNELTQGNLKYYIFINEFHELNWTLTAVIATLKLLIFNATCVSFRIALSVVLVSLLGSLIHECLSALVDSVSAIGEEEDVSFDKAFRVQESFERVAGYVDRVNAALSGVTLIWYVSAICSCCFQVTHYVIKFSGDFYKYKLWNIPGYFPEIGVFLALIVVASKVFEKMTSFEDCLLSLRKKATREGREAALTMISLQIKLVASKSGLKIGNTFVINKNLLISFIGVSVTYAVVYLQLNPRALNAIHGVKNNSTFN